MTIFRRIITSADQAVEVWQFLKEHAKAALLDGSPLVVTIARNRATRTGAQNAFYWSAVLEPASRQVKVNGSTFSPEVWHEYLKERFLPEHTAKGVEKWRHFPDGSRHLAMSTSDLDVNEMGAYLDEIQAHLVNEHGVIFN